MDSPCPVSPEVEVSKHSTEELFPLVYDELRRLAAEKLANEVPDRLLDVHEALVRLELVNPAAASVVKLRYFAGFTNKEAAAILEISPRKVDKLWAYAKAWLLDAIDDRRAL